MNILPCPACGNEDCKVHSNGFVVCEDMSCSVMGPNSKNEEAAILAWNAMPRHTDKNPDNRAVDLLKRIVDGNNDIETLVWDVKHRGKKYHTVFVFDGPRTFANIETQTDFFLGSSRCHVGDIYDRNEGMRVAVECAYKNCPSWLKKYRHLFRVWMNKRDPVYNQAHKDGMPF